MDVYHTKTAGQGDRVDADDWNDKHEIVGLDDFIATYGVYPSVRGSGSSTDINGALTLTLSYTVTAIKRHLRIRAYIQSRATDSNACKVLMRVDGDSNGSNYTAKAFKITDSGGTVEDRVDTGFHLLSPVQTGANPDDSMFLVELDAWIKTRIFGVAGRISQLYPALEISAFRGHYLKSVNFTNPPALTFIFPSNSYTKAVEWSVGAE